MHDNPMIFQLQLGGRTYTVNLMQPHSLAIPVAFEGERLSVFGAPPPIREAYRAGSFVGDVGQGGSCNCEVYTFNPHCCGTHTECIGHITEEQISVHEVLQDSLIPATLITVQPEAAESYHAAQPGDVRITRKSLEKHLSRWERSKSTQAISGEGEQAEIKPSPGSQTRRPLPVGEVFLQTLILRTLPNDDSKHTRNYNESTMPPYFSQEAMEFIVELGVKHLLVDIPSIDRLDDGGKLTNHRVFWNEWGSAPNPTLRASPCSVGSDTDRKSKTITELIYVPNEVADGQYLLNLQIAPFMADVAPSRPVVYGLNPG